MYQKSGLGYQKIKTFGDEHLDTSGFGATGRGSCATGSWRRQRLSRIFLSMDTYIQCNVLNGFNAYHKRRQLLKRRCFKPRDGMEKKCF